MSLAEFNDEQKQQYYEQITAALSEAQASGTIEQVLAGSAEAAGLPQMLRPGAPLMSVVITQQDSNGALLKHAIHLLVLNEKLAEQLTEEVVDDFLMQECIQPKFLEEGLTDFETRARMLHNLEKRLADFGTRVSVLCNALSTNSFENKIVKQLENTIKVFERAAKGEERATAEASGQNPQSREMLQESAAVCAQHLEFLRYNQLALESALRQHRSSRKRYKGH